MKKTFLSTSLIILMVITASTALSRDAHPPVAEDESNPEVNRWMPTLTQRDSYNVTIIESQSYMSGHDMDAEWLAIATNMGHAATIAPQSTLDDIANLADTDILIVSSGVIDLPTPRAQTIVQFLTSHGPAYLQGEYTCNYTSNISFSYIVGDMGGSFSCTGTTSGDLSPMNVMGDLSTTPNAVPSLPFFHYGASGSGDSTVTPFLEFQGQDYGYVFQSTIPGTGKLFHTTDQDWARAADTYAESAALMANILASMAENTPVSNSDATWGQLKALYR